MLIHIFTGVVFVRETVIRQYIYASEVTAAFSESSAVENKPSVLSLFIWIQFISDVSWRPWLLRGRRASSASLLLFICFMKDEVDVIMKSASNRLNHHLLALIILSYEHNRTAEMHHNTQTNQQWWVRVLDVSFTCVCVGESTRVWACLLTVHSFHFKSSLSLSCRGNTGWWGGFLHTRVLFVSALIIIFISFYQTLISLCLIWWA